MKHIVSTKQLVDDSQYMYKDGRFQSALLMLLIAIAASSRKMFPFGITLSNYRHPTGNPVLDQSGNPRKMGDKEAFATYFDKFFPRIMNKAKLGFSGGMSYGVDGLCLFYKGKPRKFSKILYQQFRNSLIHEAKVDASADLVFSDISILQSNQHCVNFDTRNDKITIDHGILPMLAEMVALGNPKEFGIVFTKLQLKPTKTLDSVITKLRSIDSTRSHRAEGMVHILQEFILHAKPTNIVTASDDQIKTMLIQALKDNAINGGAITGLVSVGLADKGPDFDHRALHSLTQDQQVALLLEHSNKRTLTTIGLEITRDLAQIHEIVEVDEL